MFDTLVYDICCTASFFVLSDRRSSYVDLFVHGNGEVRWETQTDQHANEKNAYI